MMAAILLKSLWSGLFSMDTVAELQQSISRSAGLHVDLVINENSSHLFTILERKSARARLSVHRMFLEAPVHVIEALGQYVRGFDKQSLSVVSRFIDESVYRPEYSQKLDARDLQTFGDYYDLKEAFLRVNNQYFEGTVNLLLTWFRQKTTQSRIIFGQYHPLLRLIKINKKLDSPQVPSYFLDYVIYHEILHQVVPTKTDERGRRSIHSGEFRKRERQFEHYDKAAEWQSSHRHLFFA